MTTMAYILFGGPQAEDKHNPVHDDLVTRLEQEGHEVDYIESGEEMLASLSLGSLYRPTELVIYDTALFFGLAKPKAKIKLFNDIVIGYLKSAQAPVIVLAEDEMIGHIDSSVSQAGFSQIKQPYNIDEVIDEIGSCLKKDH